MVVVALVLARLLIWLTPNVELPVQLSFVFTGGVEGARGLLSAVASATFGVAATLFSITLAALSSVISSMGPRLLLEFIKDRFIQTTLGIFLATFVFSLVSLRSVNGGEGLADGEFIPYLNVTCAIGLAIVCVGFLIYYIVHMAQTISLSHVVHLLAKDMNKKLHSLVDKVEDNPRSDAPPVEFYEGAETVHSEKTGYVTVVDYAALLKSVNEEECALKLLVKPGDMVLKGEAIAHGVPHAPEGVARALLFSDFRDEADDVLFAVRQLTEIGVRGLSSGTNDPYTVLDVVDHFIQVLAELGDKPFPEGVVYSEERFRLDYATVDYADLIDAMFTQIRRDTKDSTVVYIRLLDGIARLGNLIDSPYRREVLRELADSVYSEAHRRVEGQRDSHILREKLSLALGSLEPHAA